MEECRVLENGRLNILLRGLAPFRVVEEQPGEPYRLAAVSYRQESGGEASAMAPARQRILSLLGEQIEGILTVRQDVPDDVFVNALCQSLEFSPVERQSLLECETTEDRGIQLLELLRFHRLEGACPGGSPTLH
jgi:Lon protease-like protein